jgi:hypothetical protein
MAFSFDATYDWGLTKVYRDVFDDLDEKTKFTNSRTNIQLGYMYRFGLGNNDKTASATKKTSKTKTESTKNTKTEKVKEEKKKVEDTEKVKEEKKKVEDTKKQKQVKK